MVTLLPSRANAWPSSHADRPGADHQEARRQLGEREDGLVGEESGRLEAGNQRSRGPASSGDDRAPKIEPRTLDLDHIGTDKPSLTEEDVHPEPAETGGTVKGT